MLRRAFRDVEHGFYIDVGAQREESDSVTKAFSLAGWRGINIEPHPGYFEELVRGRPHDINLDVAIGEREGSLTISFIDDTGLSTADSKIARQHAAAGYAIRAQEVSMLTLNTVWQRHVAVGQPVHFLKVDVEGLEQAVLAGNNWKNNRPWIVLVEATLPNSQVENHESWEPILLEAGYMFVYADGLNRFYVADEHAERSESFKYPPNVFDGFITLALQRCIEDVKTLRRSIAEIESSRADAAVAMAKAGERERALGERLTAEAAGHLLAMSALSDAQARASALSQEKHALEQGLRESYRRIELAEEALANAHRATARAEEALANAHGVTARAEEALAQALGRESELLARLEAAGKSWFDLSRWFRDFVPGKVVYKHARRAAKAAWWAVTPWRIPARLRFIRARKLSVPSETPKAKTTVPQQHE